MEFASSFLNVYTYFPKKTSRNSLSCTCACLFSTGAVSLTASAVTADYVPSPLEQETSAELRELMAKAEAIMQDPAKLKYLAQRIQQVRQGGFGRFRKFARPF